MSKNISRRKFLVRGGLGTLGVLAIGTYVLRNPIRRQIIDFADSFIAPYSGTGTEPNLWFEITKNNTIVLHSPKVEMGQGTFTGLAQIAADELDINIDQIEVIAASTASGVVDSLGTGGSLSVASLWQPLREMAATMREMIKIEAAKKLQIPLANLSTKNGIVSSNNQQISYVDAIKEVTEWKIPDTPKLKDLKDYKLVGKPIARIDLKTKVFGNSIFGMDAEMENMLHAAIIRPEHIGATFKSANYQKAEKMPGIVKVVQIDDWVGIIAETYAQALAAKMEVDVEWNIPKIWTEEDIRTLISVGNGSEMVVQKEGNLLEKDDKNILEIEFKSPLGAHAQMEPNGAVASFKDGKITVILSTQVIGITQNQVAKAFAIDKDNVNIIPTYLGGGFGRRLNTSHAIQAVQLSKEIGRPVKYFFTRKEEFQNDMFRPPTHHIMKGKLNSDGLIENLEHHFASGNVAIDSTLMPGIAHTILGADFGAIRGGSIHYSAIKNIRSIQWHKTLPFATSWWRSLGLLANTFAIESFVDELALQSNKNPVTLRLAQIKDNEEGVRLKNVIEKAAKESKYSDEVVNGRAMGFACSTDTGTPCAQVAEVSIVNSEITVHKITCVMDCGIAVNPDQVKAQCEGAMIMAMSASMYEKMYIEDGQLQPTIFGPYDMALLKHTPKEINIHLLQGVDKPLPVGEPPLGPIAAAIGNAVRRITGQRLTEMPFKLS
ncbi:MULTISPECIES: xanthine dehydrogenase family protein molybdopterin-binding subunit [unclassified Polaribacter]|uniref:xanthine dehydrogenase family protein molybdopterin-binding subunit n=1 Tax=unclassified Polaribacter TaxID=196858 RepID=UPI0011BF7A6D|nr:MULTISPECIES: molybdopterin cofactor-binding domain-containing protein [unclassified Polaribacter]TXD52681.1 molybdopterin-dependent oxidoreductase [Polaribacter sp. IC063]TXD60649.1 molybdopterin-dependent oxidoreductase [Polaribacter sp. IC066]